MLKIGGNAFLAGAAVSYIVSVITFQALVSTTVDNPYAAVASTAAFSAAVPAVAYCVGWAVANSDVPVEAYLFPSLYVILSLAFLRARELGFWASATISALAALGLFLGKLAGARFRVMETVMNSFVCSYANTAKTAGSDPAAAECFLVMFSLAFALPFAEVTAPEPGTAHAFVAGLFSSPEERVYSPGCEVVVKVVKVGCGFVLMYLYWRCYTLMYP